MDAIDLQRPDLLPEPLQARLMSIEAICRNEEFSENLVNIPEVHRIVVEIENYCRQRKIIGIHYTRAIRRDIEQNGLLIRTGDEIRGEFIRRFSHLFENEEIKFLQNLWKNNQAKQAQIRDSILWFNFTLVAFNGLGSEYLLGMYGGEQVHMGIELDTSIGEKLASIGEPLIVRCALNPASVRTYISHPWGKIMVSSFHLSIAPEAYRIDHDGRVSESILAKDLLIETAH